MSNKSVNFRVFVDFDGTIAPLDPTDRLMERYADPAWLELEAEFQAGRIPSSLCMGRQVALLSMTPADLDEAIAETKIDPAFSEFVRLVKDHGGEAMVVSDGFDKLVGGTLRAHGLDLPYAANRLEWQGGRDWRLTFPHSQLSCQVQSANCKCSHVDEGTREPIPHAVVGDGRSDICIAESADFVLAKGKLAAHFKKARLKHVAIETFADALEPAAQWMRALADAQIETAAPRRIVNASPKDKRLA